MPIGRHRCPVIFAEFALMCLILHREHGVALPLIAHAGRGIGSSKIDHIRSAAPARQPRLARGGSADSRHGLARGRLTVPLFDSCAIGAASFALIRNACHLNLAFGPMLPSLMPSRLLTA